MSRKLTKYFAKIPKKSVDELPGPKTKKPKTDSQHGDPGYSKNKFVPLPNTSKELQLELAARRKIRGLAEINPALSVNIGLSWFYALEKEFSKQYFFKLGRFLTHERNNYTIYPHENDVYYWTTTTPAKDVKVVILGQDPYPGKGQAHGLAFSVPKGRRIPKSLQNIFLELLYDVPGFDVMPSHGHLYGWAVQGVLLLNTCLTVRADDANSHEEQGWEQLTDAAIKWINANLSHVVFLLWGKNAARKSKFIDKAKHLVLISSHPSPLSAYRGFSGCQHFSQTNGYLQQNGIKPINWSYLP